MAIPKFEVLRKVCHGSFERFLGGRATAPRSYSPGGTARHSPDRRTLTGIAGDRADRQAYERATGCTAYGAAHGLLVLLERISVFLLELGIRLGRIPLRLLRRPSETRELGRILLLDRVVASVHDSLSGIRRRRGRLLDPNESWVEDEASKHERVRFCEHLLLTCLPL